MSKYPYYELKSGQFKPWIALRLGSQKTRKVTGSTIALIDSGADVCFCHENIAAFLGEMIIKEKKRDYRTFHAANNTTFKAYKVNLKIYICGRDYLCPFYISDEIPHVTPIILGQDGFFDRHLITFNKKDKTIEVMIS